MTANTKLPQPLWKIININCKECRAEDTTLSCSICDAKAGGLGISPLDPGCLFVRMLDYSKDATGEPGFLKEEDACYIVLEMAMYVYLFFCIKNVSV